METWVKDASDRDIQVQMLRIAIETRDKIDSIRGVVLFMFLMWIIGLLLFVAELGSESDSSFGLREGTSTAAVVD